MATTVLDVEIDAGGVSLPGNLAVPPGAAAVVVFAHGSGSSRFSPRNALVAEALNGDGLATLVFDLLSEDEASDRRNVFDVDLLGVRVVAALDWLQGRSEIQGLPLGLFGASTGAAGALWAAAIRPDAVASVVSRGGRPDLAARALPAVVAPTLLIVGERDVDVLRLNREAQALMVKAETALEVVPGATHLFEEPGALEQVAMLASQWFLSHR
jgi:pimeloyl-ACP methyl ester carboxylesterase